MSSPLLIDLHTAIVAMALVTPRVVICLTSMPGLGMNALSGIARKCVALVIALPAAVPTFYHVQQAPPDLTLGILLAVKEGFIGLLLGALLSIPFWVMQTIGAAFDIQRMAVQIPIQSATVDRDAGIVGGMLIQAVSLVMVQAGLLVALVRILMESFVPWPAYALTPPFEPGHFDVVVQRFGDLFWHVIVYGAPIVIPLLLIEFGFAIIGVFAKGMQVTFASAPIKNLVGLVVILVYWPTLSHYVSGDFASLLQLIPGLLDASGR